MTLVYLPPALGARMARFTLLAVLLLAISSFAQVTVTNTGFATTSGPAYPAVPVSPPILYTPIVQLGQAPTQPVQATAAANGLGLESLAVPVSPVQNQAVNTSSQQANPTFFNFGVAQFGASSGNAELESGKSLGEIAREQRQHPNGTNARVYTNSDIDQLNQTGNMVNTPSAQANNNDNWSPNNGIISPEPPQSNAVGAQSQQNEQTPTGVHSPFAPRGEANSPAGIEMTPSQPQSRPQAQVRPFSKRSGTTEIAQNNGQEQPLAQTQSPSAGNEGQAQSAPASSQGQSQTARLPRTASRLPLVGIAGLFSVSMGLFVRYQRAKAR